MGLSNTSLCAPAELHTFIAPLQRGLRQIAHQLEPGRDEDLSWAVRGSHFAELCRSWQI